MSRFIHIHDSCQGRICVTASPAGVSADKTYVKRNVDQFGPRTTKPNSTPTLLVLIVSLWLMSVTTASAGIRACKQADGSVVFQDSVCEVVQQVQTKSREQGRIPFGIEKSWFDTPSVVPDRAICTPSGCHCGMFSRKFKYGLPLAIADSLYLDGNWHRLESTLMRLELESNSSIELADLRRERDEAACNILMSQKTLRLYGNEVMKELNAKQRYAEERGLDDPAECDAGDLVVCEHTDSITLFERIKNDIRSLKNSPRVSDDEQQQMANTRDEN